MKKRFEGWYFKHQKEDRVIAFIPGRAYSGDFIQVITESASRHYEVPKLEITQGVITAGKCWFSREGCRIDLPGIAGELSYEALTPLKTDIMGPFQYLPMQCRHGVISMQHKVTGGLVYEGKDISFTDGLGYMEKDSGTSFPRAYLWLQCNDFEEACSIMISIAHIPFCGTSFTGCICAILYGSQEYRLATYRGVKILAAQPDYICLSQGKYQLEVEIEPSQMGYALRAPLHGEMRSTVRESCNARIHVCFREKRNVILDLYSGHAMYEYVPDGETPSGQ